MKCSVLSLAAVLTFSFISTAAYASGDEYYEGGERYEHGRRYDRDDYGRGGYGGGYYEGKFYGVVEAMPSGGVVGSWRVNGREVVVTPRTFIKEEYGRIGVGAQVEVKGGGTPFTAYEVEVKSGGRPMLAPPPVNPPPAPSAMGGIPLYGPIEAMPQGSIVGTWRIGGKDVAVTQRTVLKQINGPLAVGASVEVKGGGVPFTAYEIEVKGGITR